MGFKRGIVAVSVTIAITAAAASGADQAMSAEPSSGYASGELMLKYKSTATASQRKAVRNKLGASVKASTPDLDLELVQLPAGKPVPSAESLAESQAAVVRATPNYIYTTDATPNDPMFAQQWGLHNTGQTIQLPGGGTASGTADADIDAVEAWDTTTGSDSVTVAVLDSGIASDGVQGTPQSHPDLEPNVWRNAGETGSGRESNNVDDDGNGYKDDWRGWNFVNSKSDPNMASIPFDTAGHGTHVAGIIGARGNNGLGVTGVSQRVKLMPVKICSDLFVTCSSMDLTAGIEYAAKNGARVVNLSLGSYDDFTNPEFNFDDPEVRAAISGHPSMLFVVAAGNRGTDNDTSPHWPCTNDLDNVICVANSNFNDSLFYNPSTGGGSNYGPGTVHLAAPGTAILSTWVQIQGDQVVQPTYSAQNGTSMAAPQVAGAAALLLAQNPARTPVQTKRAILQSVDHKPALTGKVATGGRLNVDRALDWQGDAGLAEISNGTLYFTDAGSARNEIVVDSVSGQIEIRDYNGTQIAPGAGCSRPGTETTVVRCTMPSQINIATFGGNDNITVRTAVPAIVSGGYGDDVLITASGGDQLYGGGGNDILASGVGADTINGGPGTDRASYYGRTAPCLVYLGTTDPINGQAGENDRIIGVEDAEGGSSGDWLLGNTTPNTLIGNGGDDLIVGYGGVDNLRGGDNNDIFDGGTGADSIDGSLGSDTTSYATDEAGMVVQLSTGTGFASDGDSLIAVEDAHGGSGDDYLFGSAAANKLIGNSGDDRLYAAGNAQTPGDTLDGGIGEDELYGSAGTDYLWGGPDTDQFDGGSTIEQDFYYGGSGFDNLSYKSHQAAVWVAMTWGVAGSIKGGYLLGEDDRLDSIESAQGTAFDDTLIGDAGQNGLYGEDGADKIWGSGELDFLRGGAGNDTITSNDDPIAGSSLFSSDQVDCGPGSADRSIANAQANADQVINCEL